MKILNEQETDEFIMEHSGCSDLECKVCFYGDDIKKKCKLGPFDPDIIDKVYKHISVKINKLKVRKIQEIFK